VVRKMRTIAGLALALVFVACSGPAPEPRRDAQAAEPTPAAAAEPAIPSDPLELASIAFIGSPRSTEVKARMDTVLRTIDLPPTDDNYSRAGDVLVTLRKQFHDEQGCRACTEMGILDYMIRSGTAISKYGLPGSGRVVCGVPGRRAVSLCV